MPDDMNSMPAIIRSTHYRCSIVDYSSEFVVGHFARDDKVSKCYFSYNRVDGLLALQDDKRVCSQDMQLRIMAALFDVDASDFRPALLFDLPDIGRVTQNVGAMILACKSTGENWSLESFCAKAGELIKKLLWRIRKLATIVEPQLRMLYEFVIQHVRNFGPEIDFNLSLTVRGSKLKLELIAIIRKGASTFIAGSLTLFLKASTITNTEQFLRGDDKRTERQDGDVIYFSVGEPVADVPRNNSKSSILGKHYSRQNISWHRGFDYDPDNKNAMYPLHNEDTSEFTYTYHNVESEEPSLLGLMTQAVGIRYEDQPSPALTKD